MTSVMPTSVSYGITSAVHVIGPAKTRKEIPMPKAKTIAQFCLHHFLDTNFDLNEFQMTAADDGVMLEDVAGNRAVFQYQDGAAVMLSAKEAEDGYHGGPLIFPLSGATVHDTHSGTVPGYLTLHQIVELPDTLLAHCMTHELPTDEEVLEMSRTGRVSAENYLDILLWYLAGNYEAHYLGMAGIDAEGCCMDLIFHHLTPQAEHVQFYLEEIPQF